MYTHIYIYIYIHTYSRYIYIDMYIYIFMHIYIYTYLKPTWTMSTNRLNLAMPFRLCRFTMPSSHWGLPATSCTGPLGFQRCNLDELRLFYGCKAARL